MGRVLKVDPKTGQIIDPPSYVQSSDTVFSGAGFNDYFSLDFFDVLGRDFFTGYNSATVWGTNFISFGKLNADQINYFVEKVASNGNIIFDEFPGAFVNVGYSKYSEVSDREDVIKLFKNDNASADIQTSEFNFNFILDFKPYLDDEEVILSITQSEKSEKQFYFQSKGTTADLFYIYAKSSGSNFNVLEGSEGVTIIGSDAIDKLEIDLGGLKGAFFDAETGYYRGAEIYFSRIENFHLKGGDFSDTLFGAAGTDRFFGGAGNDRLFGREGNDNLLGGLGQDALFGDAGDDRFRAGGDAGDDYFDGGDGIDTVDFTRAEAAVSVNLGLGYARSLASFGASQGQDALRQIERVSGSAFDDFLVGDDKANAMLGNAGGDQLFGGAGNDLIDGGAAGDLLYGEAGADTLAGRDGKDLLSGGTGKDRLSGGDGDDVLVGGTGKDRLSGGVGNDVFLITARSESTAADTDLITDFVGGTVAQGDRIDLFAIDATLGLGGSNSAFAFNGTTAKAHSIWYQQDAAANVTRIFGDTDGNTASIELQIDVTGLIAFADFHFNL